MCFRNKLIGIALCSLAIGMIIIIIMPKGSLGVILAGVLFIIGCFLVRWHYY